MTKSFGPPPSQTTYSPSPAPSSLRRYRLSDTASFRVVGRRCAGFGLKSHFPALPGHQPQGPPRHGTSSTSRWRTSLIIRFVYLAAGVKACSWTEDEAFALRNHLLNGGFLMVDDFWGDRQWHHFYEIKKVFPDREPVELALDHPIFAQRLYRSPKKAADTERTFRRQCITFPTLSGRARTKRKTTIRITTPFTTINSASWCWSATTTISATAGSTKATDFIDYFNTFSMGMAYPMFLNIITYAMEH